ncbi:MAG: endonuclease [Bacteroidales bacterium]|jgi:predicted extracellular nuclease|nr:endonuclease [Bacteroidales bacterium]
MNLICSFSTGIKKEDYQARKKFIVTFYTIRIAANTTKPTYNESLNRLWYSYLFSLFFFFFLFLFSLFLSPVSAQPEYSHCCIVFYNVENLFDPIKDSVKNDGDFTPTGFYHWTHKRLDIKLNNLAKVFLSINGWEPPDIIGLAEIENANVLKKLCYNTGLKAFDYRFVHYDSPDSRGIEVALLYRKERIKILDSYPIPVVFPFESNTKNRDILYTKTLIDIDTLHLFVNHWTSRFGGEGATIPKRNYYAHLLRSKVDSLLQINKDACIIIMGDFNDYPSDESMVKYLQAKNYKTEMATGTLFNLMFSFIGKNVGTHKTKEFWGCLDQFIVSKSLLEGKYRWQIENREATIFDAPFLLVPDEKYGGVKTIRT